MRSCIIKLLAPVIVILMAGCSGPASNSSGSRPNILIAVGSDISFPHMGAYGTTWVKTPVFDRIAKNGILFMNAYTPTSKSSPSIASFLTGRNSWQLEEACNYNPFFPSKFKSLIEVLGGSGYLTGYTGKGWAPGIATDSLGNSRFLTGKAYNSRTAQAAASGISAIDYSSNFAEFLEARKDKQPFCFWFGSDEAHRKYETGSGLLRGSKQLKDIPVVPEFLPDVAAVRTDLLDYAFETEHFDRQLANMMDLLEKKGELENTLIIVTAGNGMSFPRAKGQNYEYSCHVPLAIMWGRGIRNPGRVISDFISFRDFAPTILEVAGLKESESGMKQITGNSFADIFRSSKKGYLSDKRNHVLIGSERDEVGRNNDNGYPVRGIIKDGFLYLSNYNPERWPSGNPETGYLNCDGSPTKSTILDMRRSGKSVEFWKLCFGKRGDEELYALSDDPACVKNLAVNAAYNAQKRTLHDQLYLELLDQDDPRAYGHGDVFDSFKYADESVRDFYNRFVKKELTPTSAGWVKPTDFETDEF
jgi:N-sulfoglucosamine sulfohydrolase